MSPIDILLAAVFIASLAALFLVGIWGNWDDPPACSRHTVNRPGFRGDFRDWNRAA